MRIQYARSGMSSDPFESLGQVRVQHAEECNSRLQAGFTICLNLHSILGREVLARSIPPEYV